MKYGLSEKQLEEITAFIAQYPEVETAVLFGSRALGTFREASDVDIALQGEGVTFALAAKMKFNIEEDSYLPFMFDFVAYPTITNEDLRKHIDRKGVVIFRRGGRDWRETTLADMADIVPGFAFKGEHFGDTGTLVIKIKDIVPPIINLQGAQRVDLSHYSRQKLEKYRLRKGNFVVAMTGATIGKVGRFMEEDEAYINQRVAKISPKSSVERDFVYYCLIDSDFGDFVQNNIDSHSAQENISGTSIGRYPINSPPLPEQKAIASVLSSLDDKIDLLHRQNRTLEAMAETLFRKWFVEEAQEDWEEGSVVDLIDFNPTRKLSKGEVVPYLEMAALNTSTFSPDGWYDREFSSGTKFINGDTLLARITPCLENGKMSFVTFLKPDQVGWGSTEYIVMRPKTFLHPFFAYTLARNRDFRDYAEGCMEGSSGRQRVNVDHLKNYAIKIPSKAIIIEFNSFAESAVQKLHTNSEQIRTLKKLRDTLLPKLMSGEVRVEI